ncbi:hypothetical protein J2W22_003609 [Sphingomonas kyeonggiensis]|uniref:hypothetical protein n=1 Tax=Sphingomonas kyeonggiensis TaxID=1268553 RepID=UPI002780F7B8|nr:hypothetical protein [Sphingomonas kyeonggiensis]MDQ0251521.1 hypothetical protein [Sphingomonas kyeonggiensis]
MRLSAWSGELARAHVTLERGAQFLGRGLDAGAARTIAGPYRAKVIGNGLRELDRFLQLLVLAIAAARGIALPEQERHTANLVARLRETLGVADPDRARLLALGRTRDCLFHCGGLVRRGDARGGAVMTIGWHGAGGGTLLRVAVGERLDPSARQLLDICLYYRALAAALLSEAGLAVPPESIRETPPLPGSGCATGAR